MMNLDYNLIAATRCGTFVSRLSAAASCVDQHSDNQLEQENLAPPIAFVPRREDCP